MMNKYAICSRGITCFVMLQCAAVFAATPTVARFEWSPNPVQVGKDTYFYWDIRNVKECYTTTSGSGSPELREISGTNGPASRPSNHVGTSKWYCIDLNGQRFPTDPTKFIETTRVVEDALTAPVLTKVGGTYNTGVQVGVIQQPGITYRYSLNNSAVNEWAPILNSSVPVHSSATLRVRAYRHGFDPSPEATAVYNIVGAPFAQRFEWVPMTVDIHNMSYFHWDIRNVKECYSTTSGTGSHELKPISGSNGPFLSNSLISGSSKWYCFDFNGNRLPSDPTKFLDAPRIVESPLTAPELTLPAGTYQSGSQVSVIAKPHLTYRYTLNGTEVNEYSPILSSALTLTTTATLRVKAFRNGFNPSPEARVSYIIIPANHTVSTNPGAGGSISPTSRSVSQGSSTSFTITPNNGYRIHSTSGCGGSLSGNTYTTGTINAPCSVSATFAVINHTVSTNAGAGGSIAPTSRTVQQGLSTTFTVTPNQGFTITAVAGCSGSLSGNLFTTAVINSPCQVSATFQPTAAPTQVIYLHTDVLGSVIAESDSSGQLKTTTQYKPFGEVVNNQP